MTPQNSRLVPLMRLLPVLLLLAAVGIISGCESEAPPPVVQQPEGPLPKPVLAQDLFDFGVMEVGEEREQLFSIRNEGDALLELSEGAKSCKCTAVIIAKPKLEPGEQSEVILRWRVEQPSAMFSQYAHVHTNDMRNPEIRLTVKGKVEGLLKLEPSTRWDVEALQEDKPTEFTGRVLSSILDSFEISSFTSSSPHITAEAIPLTAEELTKAQAKSGYKLLARITPAFDVGPINETLTIHTTARDGVVLKVDIVGRRVGPFYIVGPYWSSENLALRLGTFPARKGMTVKLSMFVYGDEKLEFTSVKSDPDTIRVTLAPNPESGDKNQRYSLTFEIPPGARPDVRNSNRPATVEIKTNTPKIGTIQLRLFYASL